MLQQQKEREKAEQLRRDDAIAEQKRKDQ